MCLCVKLIFVFLLDSPKGVCIIFATNKPWEVDSAILSRISMKLYVPLPDAETRAAMLASFLERLCVLGADAMKKAVGLTEGYAQW